MAEQAGAGLIGAADRALREILRRPSSKEALRTLWQNLDADSSPGLVRTALWQDPEVIFGILGVLPVLANTLIKAFDELLQQMMEKIPPELLRGFVAALIEELDQEAVSRSARNLEEIYRILMPVLEQLRIREKAETKS